MIQFLELWHLCCDSSNYLNQVYIWTPTYHLWSPRGFVTNLIQLVKPVHLLGIFCLTGSKRGILMGILALYQTPGDIQSTVQNLQTELIRWIASHWLNQQLLAMEIPSQVFKQQNPLVDLMLRRAKESM